MDPRTIEAAGHVVFERAVALSKAGSMKEAYGTLRIAAELGHKQACFHMGIAYMTGEERTQGMWVQHGASHCNS